MKIELKEVTVRELVAGYADNAEDGVAGFGGRLDIRPPYQREFVYREAQRDAVIQTATRNFPLNVMYWALRDDGDYEMIDGQQRTLSICQYVNGDFSTVVGNLPGKRAFYNLQPDEQKQILDYTLTVYVCAGKDSEKLEWFKTINIAGEKLTDQELRNAVYSGTWITDAKRYFSRNNCLAYKIGNKYLAGTPIRQEYLETALKWISNGNVDDFMGRHQQDTNASELWQYFQRVIHWVEVIFPCYRKEMKGLDWGYWYDQFKDAELNSEHLEKEITRLMQDDDVTAKKGIYRYVLSGEEKYLSIRSFSDNEKRAAYERQGGRCAISGETMDLSEMEADHITPWHLGGKTEPGNLQMISREANRRKGGK